ncbi:MAG: flagellar biosynthetic protein FliO [Deltaproteobacteria bacterium]|nr:flagellar biosynthetic protein FliO [Deltaproteobacteria bacterium]
MFLWFALLICSTNVFGYQIAHVSVSGEKKADVLFETSGAAGTGPTFILRENLIELSFPGANLSESLNGKVDLAEPHPLIRRVSSYAFENGVKARVVVNGSTEQLKDRIRLRPIASGFQLELDYPKNENSALGLLREEQLPVSAGMVKDKSILRRAPSMAMILSVLFLCAFSVGSFFLLRFLRTKSRWSGSRKYLIEKLGYCPLGPKSGVALVKVGKEFVLIGVTPNQVSILSSLPQLQQQYVEDSRLERGAFKEAVEAQIMNF